MKANRQGTRPCPRDALAPGRTAFLFDLDGTLVDSVYQLVPE
jgi:hypothetical protein